ncbi:MAG: hypothetical protein WC468_00405 [Candidatus Paceibacterota bacterium]
MTSVADVLTIMKYPVPSGGITPVCRRGRRPFSVVCPELKVKPRPDIWLTEEEAADRLGTGHGGIISMLSNRDLKPAIHQGHLYIEVASVNMRLSGAGSAKPPPRPVWSDQIPVLVMPIDFDQEPETEKEPELEDDPDEDLSGERDEFILTRLTDRTTNSRVWTADRHDPPRRRPDPYVRRDLQIKLVNYAPEQYGYRIEDVAEAINKQEIVVRNFIAGHKVKADPTGRYVTKESLKAFFKRSRGVDIIDI